MSHWQGVRPKQSHVFCCFNTIASESQLTTPLFFPRNDLAYRRLELSAKLSKCING
jgi:hypothetical protein